MKKNVPILAAALVLAACGGSQEANEANFKKALAQSEEGRYVCLLLTLDVVMPDGQHATRHTVIGEPVLQYAGRDAQGKEINKAAAKQVEILVKEGFYAKEQPEQKQADQNESGGGKQPAGILSFHLTEKGMEQARATPSSPWFCLGGQKIRKINWFTTPTPDNGVTVSEVSYQAEIAPEKWADKLIQAGGKEWEYLREPYDRTATLVQTNLGWKDMRDLGR
ncbi:Uncharacterised protein [Kingella potus]|uniref:Lipoprotein n=1 Tax=Kingella potus TaxID=265175 RepID=A0A377QYR1_9NEIS|nr:hypothetical protein [Kingella potus]UOP01578.1 hypothetical protein LVJ84_05195 [Kingella potus]STR00132.1 Uncharacterised protein [Kingella potus]